MAYVLNWFQLLLLWNQNICSRNYKIRILDFIIFGNFRVAPRVLIISICNIPKCITPFDFVSNIFRFNFRFLWWLWNKGATLEAINWYVEERKKYNDHGQMAAEFPSDDVEAFVHSGQRVFDKYKVEVLEKSVRPPRYVGDVYGKGDEGKEALMDLKFTQDAQGQLWVWSLPEIWEDEKVTNRYLTVVDVGGRSNKADWSVIVVFDRYWMMEGDKPCVVAQWYGHIDIDLLAWKAAQIAKFYDNSLLVIESNTLETHDKERDTEGDQSGFILNQIRSSLE